MGILGSQPKKVGRMLTPVLMKSSAVEGIGGKNWWVMRSKFSIRDFVKISAVPLWYRSSRVSY